MKPGFSVMILASVLSAYCTMSSASTLHCRQLASISANVQQIRDTYPDMNTYQSYMRHYIHVWNTQPLNIQSRMAMPDTMSIFVKDVFLHFNSSYLPATVYWGVLRSCEQQ